MGSVRRQSANTVRLVLASDTGIGHCAALVAQLFAAHASKLGPIDDHLTKICGLLILGKGGAEAAWSLR